MEVANGEDAFCLCGGAWVFEASPTDFILVSAPR
jgi:hypothetical protein